MDGPVEERASRNAGYWEWVRLAGQNRVDSEVSLLRIGPCSITALSDVPRASGRAHSWAQRIRLSRALFPLSDSGSRTYTLQLHCRYWNPSTTPRLQEEQVIVNARLTSRPCHDSARENKFGGITLNATHDPPVGFFRGTSELSHRICFEF